MSHIDSKIYGFLNSADVRSHFEDLNYEFTMPEAAFIVFQSKRRSLADKIAAWREISSAYPNCGMCPRSEMEIIPDFRVFLNRCACDQEDALRLFIDREPCPSNKAGYGYRYVAISSLRYADGKPHEYESIVDETNILFSSYEECMQTVKEELEAEPGFLGLTVTYYERDLKTGEMKATATAEHDSDLSIISMWMEDADDAVTAHFEGMCFKFPLPFKRGDILTDCCAARNNSPFVLNQIKLWSVDEMRENGMFAHGITEEGADRHDKSIETHLRRSGYMEMGAYCIEASERLGLFEDPLPLNQALDFEFFRGELSREHRLLQSVSEFLHGFCDVELLVNAAILLTQESTLYERKQALAQEYDVDYLEKLGIRYEGDSRLP